MAARNQASKTAQLSRRHHFLPVFYLRQWCDPASGPPRNSPSVWQISRDGKTARHKNPQNRAFWIEDGNTLTSASGAQTDLPERILGRIEDAAARTLRDRISRREPLTRDEVDSIDMFLSSLLVRVPSARQSLQEGVAAIALLERETAAANRYPAPDSDGFERNALAHAAVNALTAVLPELEQMTHRVLMAPAGEFFVTSDRPALIWSPIGFNGIANRLCEVTFPLSPTSLLLLTWHGSDLSGYCPADADDVLTFNKRTIGGCHAWFVSSQKETNSAWFQL